MAVSTLPLSRTTLPGLRADSSIVFLKATES